MIAPPHALIAACDTSAEALRQLQEDNPFLMARAERFARLDEMIAALADERGGPGLRRRLALLRAEREALLADMVAMVTGAAMVTGTPPAAKAAPVPLAQRRHNPWSWPA